ncbi:MAG: hypothetical protein DMD81_27610 [Candidatus Rokuibacteriota bacterium]|nr:MAG: hypothetical protein DMD81_27610 [Candidatus Rokubacteria bacterium]
MMMTTCRPRNAMPFLVSAALALCASSAFGQVAPPKDKVLRELGELGAKAAECQETAKFAGGDPAALARAQECAKQNERAFTTMLPVLQRACREQSDRGCQDRADCEGQRASLSRWKLDAVQGTTRWSTSAQGSSTGSSSNVGPYGYGSTSSGSSASRYDRSTEVRRRDEDVLEQALTVINSKCQEAAATEAMYRSRLTLVPLDEPDVRAAAARAESDRAKIATELLALSVLANDATDAGDAGRYEEFQATFNDFETKIAKLKARPELDRDGRAAVLRLQRSLADFAQAWRWERTHADRVAYFRSEIAKQDPGTFQGRQITLTYQTNMENSRREQQQVATEKARLLTELHGQAARFEQIAKK